MSEVIRLNDTSESILYLSKKDKQLAKLFKMIGEITYAPRYRINEGNFQSQITTKRRIHPSILLY